MQVHAGLSLECARARALALVMSVGMRFAAGVGCTGVDLLAVDVTVDVTPPSWGFQHYYTSRCQQAGYHLPALTTTTKYRNKPKRSVSTGSCSHATALSVPQLCAVTHLSIIVR